MRMYFILIILLLNYEKTVHTHNDMFSWKGLCFNYLISTLSLRLGFLKIIYSGWVIVCRKVGKSSVSMKNKNLHSFKEGVILLCQGILETRRNLHLHCSSLFTMPLMQFLSNLSKIIPSQKTADITLQILTSLDFLQQVKVKISKKLTEIIKIKSKNS